MWNEPLHKCWISSVQIFNSEGYVATLLTSDAGHLHLRCCPFHITIVFVFLVFSFIVARPKRLILVLNHC